MKPQGPESTRDNLSHRTHKNSGNAGHGKRARCYCAFFSENCVCQSHSRPPGHASPWQSPCVKPAKKHVAQESVLSYTPLRKWEQRSRPEKRGCKVCIFEAPRAQLICSRFYQVTLGSLIFQRMAASLMARQTRPPAHNPSVPGTQTTITQPIRAAVAYISPFLRITKGTCLV